MSADGHERLESACPGPKKPLNLWHIDKYYISLKGRTQGILLPSLVLVHIPADFFELLPGVRIVEFPEDPVDGVAPPEKMADGVAIAEIFYKITEGLLENV